MIDHKGGFDKNKGLQGRAMLLIDGYNLLHAFGIAGSGGQALERARRAMLTWLAARLDPAAWPRVIVVFDAKRPRREPPPNETIGQIEVRYATEHEEADDLLEELIARHATPKKLTVVSSDLRLRQAASRRRARAVASEAWLEELDRAAPPVRSPTAAASAESERAEPGDDAKPAAPASPDEIAWWLRRFTTGGADEHRE